MIYDNEYSRDGIGDVYTCVIVIFFSVDTEYIIIETIIYDDNR